MGGRYDPRHHAFDGTTIVTLNSPSIPVVLPPAYGLQGVGFETYTGDGPISYWNNYVGVSQMGGHGSFSDPRIGLTITQKPDALPATYHRRTPMSRVVPIPASQCFTMPPRSAASPSMHRAAPLDNIARPRCAGPGSTRRISTMAARQRCS